MGMSASQARLIALTARMSDLELEGQQINQQRLNLANQSSAIQEEALKMPVPTAPSTYDYMKDVYKGKDKDGNEVKAGSPDANGNITVSRFSKDPYNSMTASGTGSAQDVNTQTQPAAKIDKPSNKITATYPKESAKKECWLYDGKEQVKKDDSRYTTAKSDMVAKKTALDTAKSAVPTSAPSSQDKKYHSTVNNTDVFDQTTYDADVKDYNDKVTAATTAETEYNKAKTEFDKYKEDPNGYYEIEGTAEVTATNGASKAETNYAHAHGLNAKGKPEQIKYTFENAFGEKKTDASADDLNQASSGYSKDQIDSMIKRSPQLFTDEKGEKKLSNNDFDKKTGKLNEGVNLYEEVKGFENIGGKKAYDLNELSSLESSGVYGQKVKDIKQAINNYEANTEGAKGIADSKQLAKWRITVDETTGEVKAYKLDDNNKKATEYTMEQKNEAGWNTETVSTKNAKFDKNGVSNIPLKNGDKVYLTKSQDLDMDAYSAADAEYKNKKAQYDHAQEEANTKVKKLQTIDKQLELKLKRLDTERNALNTEIDAVKKVIQDNTDKSFKTFSG